MKRERLSFLRRLRPQPRTLIHEWQANITNTNLQDSVVLAFTRASVGYLNEQARLALKERQILGQEEITVQGFEKNR
ncbi:conjugal transfer protein TraA [Legionella pneumophila]|uniref:Conjugal transfer protein TraA n=1 Tax=Legionella pneumophila TaxID=446 RepID=A0A378LM48_LEGPN|nr:hypothetical protein [Legionella pneumophila]STY27814.1 conjugal transfer protein TraA [Legionella pneumophila]